MSLQTWQETLVSAPASGSSFGTFTTAKTVLPTGCLVTLPANWWYIGRVIRVTVQGGIGTLVTTPGTIGDIIKGWQWSQQGELLYLPTPEMREVLSVSSFLCLHLQTAVGGTRTWSGWICWEEF